MTMQEKVSASPSISVAHDLSNEYCQLNPTCPFGITVGVVERIGDLFILTQNTK
jgi:hypothetical protein